MAFENLHRLLARAGGGSSEVPYHPPPSIGHEIGVIFGGIGSMILGTFNSSICLSVECICVAV